jgi:pyruvate dehydrogenase E2 component (dihydrolipoamide acetyltransferase)
VAKITRADVIRYVSIPGTLRANQQATLYAKVAGYLNNVAVDKGDAVKAGDILAEIETDKATMEYEAVDEGTLAKIVVPEGTQDVAVNSVIAVLASEGEDVKAAASAAKIAPQAAPSKLTAPVSQPATGPKSAAATAPPPTQRAAASGTNRIFSSPLARRMAKESNVDLNRVQGSGPHGRVIARDIEDQIRAKLLPVKLRVEAEEKSA